MAFIERHIEFVLFLVSYFIMLLITEVFHPEATYFEASTQALLLALSISVITILQDIKGKVGA